MRTAFEEPQFSTTAWQLPIWERRTVWEYVTSEAANRQICLHFSILQVIILLVLISTQVPHIPTVLCCFGKRPSSAAEKLWLIRCALTGRLTWRYQLQKKETVYYSSNLSEMYSCLQSYTAFSLFLAPRSTIIAVTESIIKHGQT